MAASCEIVKELRDMEKKGLLNKKKIFNKNNNYEKKNSKYKNLKRDYYLKISLLDSLLKNIPDSIYFKDKKGQFIELSKAKADHLNKNREEIIGKTDFDFYSYKEAKKMQDDDLYVINNKQVVTREEEFTRPDGEKAWVSAVKAPRFDTNENVIGIVGISRDITDKKIAEEKLKESEETLRDLFDNANDLIQSVDSEGYFQFVNNKWKKVLGYSDDEIQNLHFTDVIRQDYLPHCKKVFKGLSEGKSFDNIEVVFVSKDNKEIFIEGNVNPIFDHEKFVGTRGIFRDITKRREAEKALRESEQRYRTIFENSAVAIMTTNKEEKIVSWNKYTEKLLGIGKKDLNNKPVKELYPQKEWDKIRSQNIRNKGMQHHLETKIYNKNKGIIDVDISLSVVKDKEGNIIGSIGVFRDISKRKEAEKALHESEQRYRTIFENSAVGIMLTNKNEELISWNRFAEELFGFDNDDLYLKPVKDFYPAEEWDKIRSQNIRKKSMQHHLETKMFTKEGKTLDVDVSVSVLKNKKGKIIGSIGIIRNITERKQMEAELEEAQGLLKLINKDLERKVELRTAEIKELLKQKDEFINQLGHDLKTPLSPLNSLLPVVKKKVKDEQSKKYLDLSIQNVKYMKNLVRKTLKLALLNSNSFQLDIDNINAWEIIDRVIKNRLNNPEDSNVRFKNLVEKNVMIKADVLRFEELVDNIISNAIKYSDDNVHITINSEEENNKIVFSIKDNGIGMTREQINKMFDEFYKADESRHDFDSSGLGLSICERIVSKHGGDIWALSPGPGKGTTFYFTFEKAKNKRNSK